MDESDAQWIRGRAYIDHTILFRYYTYCLGIIRIVIYVFINTYIIPPGRPWGL